MSTQLGDRVGAVSHEDAQGRVYLFGFGVYQGMEVPRTAAGWMGKAMREANRVNPKILLDSGKVVWGCECWWGAETAVRRYLEGKEIVEYDIEEARKVDEET